MPTICGELPRSGNYGAGFGAVVVVVVAVVVLVVVDVVVVAGDVTEFATDDVSAVDAVALEVAAAEPVGVTEALDVEEPATGAGDAVAEAAADSLATAADVLTVSALSSSAMYALTARASSSAVGFAFASTCLPS